MKESDKKIVNDLFDLWNILKDNGELYIGAGFIENYKRLKKEVERINNI